MKSPIFSLLIATLLLGAAVPPSRAGDAAPSAPRGTIVIVHGAWGAAYEWKEVGRRLRAEGFDVYRPTLTGMGERSHLANADIDLDTHITDVVNTILFEDLHDVILIGHSYGGMVITGVADRLSERIKHIVYLDAFLPENGESTNSALGGAGIPATDGFVIPPWHPAPTPPPHVVPQPAKTFSQPIKLEHQDAVAKIPATYILTVEAGKKPEQDTFFRFYTRARERGWKTLMMESDHTPQFSHIPEIVSLLTAEAK